MTHDAPPISLLRRHVECASSVRTVALELLWGCNLRCSYCYIGTAKNWDAPSIPRLEQIAAVIDAILKSPIEDIYFVGGEPLAHPQFEQICDLVGQHDSLRRGVCSNGTLFTQAKIEALRRNHFYVDVTVRGGTALTFDAITAKNGSFEQCLRGIRALREAGIIPSLEFDCTPSNHKELYNLVENIIGRHHPMVRNVLLHRIAPHGDAAQASPQFDLTTEMYEDIFKQARAIKKDFGVIVAFEDGYPLCLTSEENWEHILPCDCGFGLLTIAPNGDVRRCACVEHVEGNVFDRSLQDIWRHALSGFRTYSWLPDSCKGCAMLFQCRGGCAASNISTFNTGYCADRFAAQFKPFITKERAHSFKVLRGTEIIEQRVDSRVARL